MAPSRSYQGWLRSLSLAFFHSIETLHFDYKIPLLTNIRLAIDGRFSLNQGTPLAVLYFFPAVSNSQYFSPLLLAKDGTTFRSRPVVAVRLPHHRRLRSTKNNHFRYRYNHFFSAVGVFKIFYNNYGEFSRKEREKNPKNLASIPHF
ncbi:hypothetical protein FNW25_00920 [Flavobacterium franklandianum]|uniref:Uncharacterized protein n=1 Tax=Flavobacterium franklandianum TaxID=2594430 RepID=A0A553CL35_9FLAO|nr:hypothetical protein [Flavobacterium franklandianum]TRX21260.1 hypothetical protein FNW17_07860 [Flavobacterium franklandianum]TRX30090.1 hypothetical protein FNW25_00920 [Flavobacterium franklandianum]